MSLLSKHSFLDGWAFWYVTLLTVTLLIVTLATVTNALSVMLIVPSCAYCCVTVCHLAHSTATAIATLSTVIYHYKQASLIALLYLLLLLLLLHSAVTYRYMQASIISTIQLPLPLPLLTACMSRGAVASLYQSQHQSVHRI
jgi:hypothetical protein